METLTFNYKSSLLLPNRLIWGQEVRGCSTQGGAPQTCFPSSACPAVCVTPLLPSSHPQPPPAYPQGPSPGHGAPGGDFGAKPGGVEARSRQGALGAHERPRPPAPPWLRGGARAGQGSPSATASNPAEGALCFYL